MPRELGPERAYFGGENGVIAEESNGKTRYYCRCQFCNWTFGGKIFSNTKDRHHLSGDPALRNGMIARVYTQAPEDVKKTLLTSYKGRRSKDDTN